MLALAENRPSVSDSPRKRDLVHAGHPGNFGDSVETTAEGNAAVIAPVVGLVTRRGLAAITWLIVAVIIDTVKGFAARSLAHVDKEVFEREPTITDRDSASRIDFVSNVSVVGAPRDHRCPRTARSVPSRILFRAQSGIAEQAAARFCIPTSQFGAVYNGLLVAIAAATPPYFSVPAARLPRNNNKAAKSLASNVHGFHQIYPLALAMRGE